jgi:hypothetical protein
MKPQTVTRLIAIAGRGSACKARPVDHLPKTLGQDPGCLPPPGLPWSSSGPKCDVLPVRSLRLVSREGAIYSVAEGRSVIASPHITFLGQIGAATNIDFSAQALLEVHYIESKALWGDVKILKQARSEERSEMAVC